VTRSDTPSVDEVRRIAAISSPAIRNLEVTYCYSRLAAAFSARGGDGANWCMYATWASRQAGRTIRGEDLLEHLSRKLGEGRCLLHPIATLWRRFLRRGLFQSETRIGRLTAALHAPFDAFELASYAVARGNLKVFEEIGLEFARYLEEYPPDAAAEPAAFRQQTRLQPEIRESLDAAYATQEDLGRRALELLVPSAARWSLALRRPAAALVGVVAAGAQRSASRLAREAITESLMVLSLPGRALALGAHLADAYPEALAEPADADLIELLRGVVPDGEV
jgi:hypothetical protein